MILQCGFLKANAQNLGVLPMIVNPASCCGRHCFYMRCWRVFFGIVNSPTCVTVGRSLSLVVQAISIRLDLMIAGSDGYQFLLTLRT